MPWILNYTLSIPANYTRAQLLFYLNKAELEIKEINPMNLQIRSKVNILFSKHPLSSITKADIFLESVESNQTSIGITIYPNSLRQFAILFPICGIIIITLFAHWITQTPMATVIKGLWTIDLAILAGSVLIYLLIKQTVIHYFNRIIDEIRQLDLGIN